ncbi:MAG: RNA methyltransferase [Candidatus Micrarchaeota archaeon]
MIRVVLVEPMYPVNLGSVCRVMKNFGAKDLYLVRPRISAKSQEAVMYAKSGIGILKKAKIVSSLDEAARGTDIVVGTTGVSVRFSYALKSCVTPRDLCQKISKKDRISLVFGNEGTGLTLDDLKKCDILVTIPSAKKFAVLNLSHSVGILLYELYTSSRTFIHYRPAKRKDILVMQQIFRGILEGLLEIRDKRKVGWAFENILKRSRISDEEIKALFVAIGGIGKRIRK